MYLLYSLLLTVGFILMVPRFALDALRTRKYLTGLRERLGNLSNLQADGLPLIWLHCVSVGETEAAKPLVRGLREKFPNYRLVVSTTTVTGQQVARNAFAKDALAVFYFPIDWAWVVRRVLRQLNPAVVLIMETELWPNLLRACRRQGIPSALVNGRISDKSFRRYRSIRGFMQRVLRDISLALMQSDQDANRIRELGLPDERILIAGNLKFDSASTSAMDPKIANELRERFALGSGERLLVAASTHSPEEQIVIEAFASIRSANGDAPVRLVIAPRHPERFNEVAELLAASGYRWSRRSEAQLKTDKQSDVILLDSIGELRAIFALADLAFIGGSIAPHGGHNVLEPAAQGVCVVTGPHTQNFAAIVDGLRREDAIVQLDDVSDAEAPAVMAAAITKLLVDDSRRIELGRRAQLVCERNTGATARAIAEVAKLLKTQPTAAPLPISTIPVNAAK